MAVNALQYIKNVGKSFGYSAIDALKDYNPQIAALASGAKELSSELYETIDDFKASIKGTDDSDEKGLFDKGRNAVKDLRNNLLDDLKSGNWYNKERIATAEEQAMKEMFGFDESDFNLDDLDNWDFDFDEDEESSAEEDSTALITSTQKQTANAIINTMDAVGSKSANAIAGATVKSADYVAASQRQSSRALYSLNQKGFAQVSTGLAAINSNIASLVTLGEPLTTHMQNSATFYTESSEYHKSVLEKLDKIIGYIAPEDTRYTHSRGTRFGDMITAEGVIDLPGYFNMVKDNIKSMADEIGGMVDMMGGLDSLISMFTSSPMKNVTSGAINLLVPNIMKQSMQAFNKSLEAFFPAALDKLQSANLGMFDMFKDILFPKRDSKTTIETENYNKGRVSWTGESEMALKEVIPTYLAAITSALTGGPMTHYDYKNGKFVTIQGVKNVNDNRIKRAAQSAGGDFRSDALAAIRAMNLSKEEEAYLTEGVENYFLNSFKKGSNAATKINNSNFNYKDFQMNEEALVLLRSILQQYEKSGSTRAATQFASNIRTGQERYYDELRSVEAENGVDRALYNNSSVLTKGNKTEVPKAGGLFGAEDEFHNDIFFYLRGIWESNYLLADNMSLFGSANGGGGKGKRGKGGGGGRGGSPNLVGPRSFTQNPSDASEKSVDRQNDNKEEKEKQEAERPYVIPEEAMRKAVDENSKWRGDQRVRTSGEKRLDEANKRKREIENKQNWYRDALGEEYELTEDEKDFLDKYERGEAAGPADKFHLKIRDNIDRLLSVPGDAFAKILRSGEESLYHLIYGTEGSEDKGLFGYFYEKADKLFDTFDQHFEKKLGFSLREWAKNFIGDKFGGIANDTKDELKNAYDWFTGKAKNIIGIGETKPVDNGNAARGRKVTKTGIVAVSEGEMIIPSQYNPFYHGPSNTRQQLHNENEAIKRFYGSFATGGTVGKKARCPECGTELTDGWYCENCGYADEDAYHKYLDEINKKEDRKKELEQTRIRHKNDRNRKIQEMKKGKKTLGGNLTLKDMFYGSISQLYNGISEFMSTLLPKDDKKEGSIIDKVLSDKQQQAIKDANIPQEAISNRGAIGAGAIIGAGASLLTGAIVGPFAGAAIGAGVGLVVKSEAVQKALFGDVEVDDKGNPIGRKGGLLSKEISDFMTQRVPSIGVGAGVGAIGGLFMGSPVLGAIVGGALGFAVKSNSIKDALFGKMGENGERDNTGIFSQELQKKLKNAMPNIGAGALAGLIAGPFGPVVNVIVGSAVGYASTTKSFQDMILGKEDSEGNRVGGLVGKLQDSIFGVKGPNGKRTGGMVSDIRGIFFGSEDDYGNKKQGILESVTGIFKKVGNEIVVHSKELLRTAGRTVRRAISGGLKSTFEQFFGGSLLGRMIGGAVGTVGKAGYSLVTAPLRVARWGLQGIDEFLGRRSLGRGYNLQNKEGKSMTSTERIAEGRRIGSFRYDRGAMGALDVAMSSGGSGEGGAMTREELEQLQGDLDLISDPTAQFEKNIAGEKSTLARMLDEAGVPAKTARQIESQSKRGHLDKAVRLVSNLPIGDDAKANLINQLRKIDDEYNNKDAIQEEADKKRKELEQQFGIKLKSKGQARRGSDLVANEIDRLFPNKTEEEKKAEEKEKKEDQALDAQIEAAEIVKKVGNVYEEKKYFPTHDVGEPNKGENKEEGNKAKEAVDNAASSVDTKECPNCGKKVPVTDKFCRWCGVKFEGSENTSKSGPSSKSVNPATKNCPKCGAELPINATECDECGFVYANAVGNTARKIVNEANENRDVKPKHIEFNIAGEPMQYVENNQGEPVLDMQDQETREAAKTGEALKTGLLSFGAVGTALGGLKAMFGDFKDKLLGSGEGTGKKEGLLSKLFNSSDGFLGGIFNTISGLFGNSKIVKAGKGVMNFLRGISIPGVVTSGILISGLYGLFKGDFDEILAKATHGSMADNTTKVVKMNGQTYQLQKDDEGNYITDDEGNYIATDGTVIDKNAYIQDVGNNNSGAMQAVKNTATGLVMGTGSLVTAVAKKAINSVTGGKGSAKIAEKATEVAGKALGKVANTGLGASVLESIAEGLAKLPQILQSIPFIKNTKIAQNCDTLVKGIFEIAEGSVSSATQATLQNLAGVLSNALFVLKVATVVIAAWNGYGEAEIYFDVKEATLGEKIISGIVSAINCVIPVIGNLIPNKTIIQFFIDHAGIFGIDMSTTKQRQEELQKEVDEYNAEHGTDLNNEQYLELEGKGGIGRKVKNTAKSIVNNVKNFFTGNKEESTEVVNNGTNASGNLYTQEGLAAVSNGEIIVSPEDNPAISTLLGGSLNRSNSITSLLGKALGTVTSTLNPFDEANIRKTLLSEGLTEEEVDRTMSRISSLTGTPQAIASRIKDIVNDSIDENGKFHIGSLITNSVNAVEEATSGTKFGDTITKAKGVAGNVSDALKEIIGNSKGENEEITISSLFDSASSYVNGKGGIKNTITSLLGIGTGDEKEELEEEDESLQNEAKNYSDYIDKLKDYASKGDINKLLKAEYKAKDDEDGTMTGLFKGMYSLQKLYYTAFAMIADPLGVVDTSSSGSSSSSSSSSSDSSESAADVVEESSGGFFSKLKKLVTGKGSGLKRYTGGASGVDESFVSQDDSKYRNIKYGTSTIGNIGCGPAAATMMINGSNPGAISMKDAVKYAQGYQSGDGTSADYFGDILSNYGLPADYIDSSSEKGERDLRDQVLSGRSTILLGRDPDNDSKSRSPFGPSSHYVVATGVDSSGNIIVNDPESNKPGRVYSPSILNNVSLGIAGDMSAEATDNYESSIGGDSSVKDTPTAQSVWGYFTSRGFSPEATAGILGNMFQESGVDPRAIQNGGKGPAAGIVQWEDWKNNDKRWAQMNKYAQSLGREWTDLDAQLKFADNEFTGEVPGVDSETWRVGSFKTRYGSIDAFKNLTDVKEATKGFEELFEGAGQPDMQKRYNYSNEYYNLYKGSPYTGVYNGSVSNGTGYTFSAVGDPHFIKYTLTDTEIKQLANLATQEQGTTKGAAAEASLMANLWERDQGNGKYSSLYDYVRNSTWFANAAKFMDNGPATGKTTDETINAVKQVLNEGKRTLPGYIDEHDCFSDFKEVTNNGVPVSPVSDRTQYQKDVTKLHNVNGSHWTFWGFPDTASDPFGYTDANRNRAGVEEGYYNLDGSVAMGGTSGEGGSEEGTSAAGILDTLKNALKSVFSPLLGGADTGNGTSGSSGSATYSNMGGEGNAQQQELVNVLQPYVGKLQYDMEGARNPEKGSADCSSTVNWAYKKVLNDSIGDDTPSILNSSKTSWVDMPNPGIDKDNPGSTSAGPDINNLMPGDLLLYTRYNSSSGFANSRPYKVGHVEMYAGNAQRLGHGGPKLNDLGPNYSSYDKDKERYIGAKRYNSFLNQTSSASSSSTSTDTTTSTEPAEGISRSLTATAANGAGSGLMPTVTKMKGRPAPKKSSFRRFSGGASSTDDEEEETTTRRKRRSSSSDSSDVVSLLKKILKATQEIADNTTDVPDLTTTLTNYCKASLTTEVAEIQATAAQAGDGYKVDPKDDVALQSLMSTLGAIAQG